MIDAARVLIHDAGGRVEEEARRALGAVHEGDMLATQMAVLKRFAEARARQHHRIAPKCCRRGSVR